MLSKKIGLTAGIKLTAVSELVGQMHQAYKVRACSVAGHMTLSVPTHHRARLPLRNGPLLCSYIS